jgi:hypothetical protein
MGATDYTPACDCAPAWLSECLLVQASLVAEIAAVGIVKRYGGLRQ